MTDTIKANKKKFMDLINEFGGSDNLTPIQVNELCKIPIVRLSPSLPETLEDWLELYQTTSRVVLPAQLFLMA